MIKFSNFKELLTEAQYDDMFQSILNAWPEDISNDREDVKGSIDQTIKSIKKLLKKNDKIIWLLRYYKLSIIRYWTSRIKDIIEAVDRENEPEIFKQYINFAEVLKKEFDKLKGKGVMNQMSYTAIKGNLEHFMSLDIDEIDDMVFGNKPAGEVLDELRDIEERSKEGSEGMISTREHDRIIKKLSDDYYWVSLDKAFCPDEGEAMGHCGNSPRKYEDDNIFSLRKLVEKAGRKFWYPIVTVTVDNNNYTWEIKGRGNNKPKDEYIPMVVELLKDPRYISGMREGVGYMPENNLLWDRDLEPWHDEIYESNPDIDIEKKDPIKIELDIEGAVREFMRDDDFQIWDYANRFPEDYEDEYEDAYNNMIFPVMNTSRDFEEAMEEAMDFFKYHHDSEIDYKKRYPDREHRYGWWYDEQDNAMINIVDMFENGGFQYPPENNMEGGKELAKEVVYDWHEKLDEIWKDEIDKIDNPEEDDLEIEANRMKNTALYKFMQHFQEKFPYEYAWEKEGYAWVDPNQMEFNFNEWLIRQN